MGFFEKVMNWIGYVEEIEEETAAAQEEDVPAWAADADKSGKRRSEREKPKRGKLVGLPGGNTPMRVVVVDPQDFDDVQGIADHLKERRPVVVNLERANHELARRIVDFLMGSTYAVDGSVQRIGEDIFLFTPSNVSIETSRFFYDEVTNTVFPWMRED